MTKKVGRGLAIYGAATFGFTQGGILGAALAAGAVGGLMAAFSEASAIPSTSGDTPSPAQRRLPTELTDEEKTRALAEFMQRKVATESKRNENTPRGFLAPKGADFSVHGD